MLDTATEGTLKNRKMRYCRYSAGYTVGPQVGISLCAVVLAVGGIKPKCILSACINIAVAANAGGAFSPFGDITTLMVWPIRIPAV